jgi:hypothetical protein
MEMTAPIVFLDTETDGVHEGRKVWEIAAVRREPDDTEVEWQAFVDIDLSTADPFGLRVGRFYERHPLGRGLAGLDPSGKAKLLSPNEAAFLAARITHGAHIVGAVPNFDTEVLGRLLREHGLTPAWHYHLIDVEALAVGYLAADTERFGKGTPPPWKSDELGEALGVEQASEQERHTAMGDVRWVMRMYDAVMGGVGGS